MKELGQIGITLLYFLGMALVVAEVLLPGVVLGLVGTVLVVTSIVLAFLSGAVFGWILVGLTVLSIPGLIWLWIRVVGRALAMNETEAGVTGSDAGLQELMGREGVALTQLRPAGMAQFGDRKVDVVSDGPVVERNERIVVLEVTGNRVVVRAARR